MIDIFISGYRLLYTLKAIRWYNIYLRDIIFWAKWKVFDEIEYYTMHFKLWLKHKNFTQRTFIIWRWYDIQEVRIERYNRKISIENLEIYAKLAESLGVSQFQLKAYLGDE